ncbi:MAG: toprim domain-containing protein [Candidatus Aenigmatarchaeota archaeon]|jgi:5S rRNA maturation endonuclease (ribonuclease M5)
MEILEELKDVIEKMNREIDCVIVEGKNDKVALEMLGLKKKILYHFQLEKIEGKVVILTDFDREGNRIAKEITRKIGEKRIEKIYREKFRKILKKFGRNDIQSIKNLIEEYYSKI